MLDTWLRDFVESLLPWICEHSHLDMYFVISDSSGRQKLKSAILQRDFTWIFLTHKEVGGILHGGWKIGARTRRDLAEIRTRSKVTPGIRDYVSSIVSGQETPELSYAKAKQAGLLPNMDLLPRTGILHQNISIHMSDSGSIYRSHRCAFRSCCCCYSSG